LCGEQGARILERMSRVLLNLGWRPPVTIRPPSCPHSGLRD
jgi:hypothetical protein